MANFMGKQGFQWFVGVVEDRNDPKTLGRLRVRCLGYHTELLDDLKTENLPWAHVMNPVTSATVSGLGQTPLGAVEGTWVVGFFQDGADAQQPIIIGTLPGVPSELPDTDSKKGFMDAVNGAYPKYKETDVNRLAVNSKSEASGNKEATEDNTHSSLTIRRADLDKAVGTAQIDGIFSGVAQITSDLDTDNGGKWDEPTTPYDAKYPHNHVYESESGHIREIDDTPNKERIHERHNSGTGYEIHPEGNKVTRVKQDNYTIVTNDDYTHIQGTQRHTTDEGVRIRVNANGEDGNNYNIEVGNGANVNVEVNKGNINLTTLNPDVGDININASRNLNIQVGKDMNVSVLGNASEIITGTKDELVQSKNTKTGSEIDMDAGTINLN